MTKLALAVSLSIVAAGCSPFPWWTYLAETSLDSGASSEGFSAGELRRAQVVAADVARAVGMKSDAERHEDINLERRRSATLDPPRRFLSVYTGMLSEGRPLELRVETSDDGRVLYFSLSDFNRGTASPTVERIDQLLRARVETAFPGVAIDYEPKTLGPFFSLPP